MKIKFENIEFEISKDNEFGEFTGKIDGCKKRIIKNKDSTIIYYIDDHGFYETDDIIKYYKGDDGLNYTDLIVGREIINDIERFIRNFELDIIKHKIDRINDND